MFEMDIPIRKRRIAQPPRKMRPLESQRGHDKGLERRRNNVYQDERRHQRQCGRSQNEDQDGRWSSHGKYDSFEGRRQTKHRPYENQNGTSQNERHGGYLRNQNASFERQTRGRLVAVEEGNPTMLVNVSYSPQPIPPLQLSHLSRLDENDSRERERQSMRLQSPKKRVAQSTPMSSNSKRQKVSSLEAQDVPLDRQAMKLIQGLKMRQMIQPTGTVALSTEQSNELEPSSKDHLGPPQTLESLFLPSFEKPTKAVDKLGVAVQEEGSQAQQPTLVAAIQNTRRRGTRGLAVRIKNKVLGKPRGRKPRPSFSAKVPSYSPVGSKEQTSTENEPSQNLEPKHTRDHRPKYTKGSSYEVAMSYVTSPKRGTHGDTESTLSGFTTRKRDTIKQLLESSPSTLELISQLSVPEFKRLQQQIEAKSEEKDANANAEEQHDQPLVKIRGGGGHKGLRSYGSKILRTERTSSLRVPAPIPFMYEYAGRTHSRPCALDLFSGPSLFISPAVSSHPLYWDIGSNQEWRRPVGDLDGDTDDLREVKERAKVSDHKMSEASEGIDSNTEKESDHKDDCRMSLDLSRTSQIPQDPNFRSFALGLRPRTRLRGGYLPSLTEPDDSTSGSPISDYAFSPSSQEESATKTPLFIDFLEEQSPMQFEFPIELKLPSNLTKEIADNFRIKATIRAVQYNDYGECLGYGETVQIPVVLEDLEMEEPGLSLHFSARINVSLTWSHAKVTKLTHAVVPKRCNGCGAVFTGK